MQANKSEACRGCAARLLDIGGAAANGA